MVLCCPFLWKNELSKHNHIFSTLYSHFPVNRKLLDLQYKAMVICLAWSISNLTYPVGYGATAPPGGLP